MHPLKNIKALLQPTLASFAIALVLSVLAVGSGLWFSDLRSGVLFNTLAFGSNAPAGTITTTQTTLAQFNDRVFGNPLLNKILFYSVWLFIGCLVYMVVTAIISFGSESVETVEELNYIHARRAQLERVFLSRLTIRIAAIGLEIAYCVAFVKLILPYSIYAVHVAINQTYLLNSVLYIAGATVALLIGWHIHVVLLRLIALRTRLITTD
jgi:hypothetical protein